MNPSLINEASSIRSAIGSSHSLAKIWSSPLSSSGVVSKSGDVLGSRRGRFGRHLCGFGEMRTANLDVLVDDSAVSEKSRRSRRGGGKKRRDASASEDELSKLLCSSSGNDMNDNEAKRSKLSGSRDENEDLIPEVEVSSGVGSKPAKQSTQPSEPPTQDYIHVRARRGQATDSHSLAERARREKIGERMKILQDLVPGCYKVIGKALVLDEIINYIQSLQHQVEFLSMKLEAVNSRMDPSIDGFPSKVTFDTASTTTYDTLPTREYCLGSPPEWLHMQVGHCFEKAP